MAEEMEMANEKEILKLVGSSKQRDRVEKVFVSENYAFVVSDNPVKLGNPEKPVLCMLYIIDISNPKKPQKISSFESPGALIDVAAAGNFVYLVETAATKPEREGAGCTFNRDYGGVRVLDISKAENPHEVGFFHTEGLVRGGLLKGDLFYLIIKDSPNFAHLYIKKRTTIRGRLQVIDVSKPEKMQEVGRFDSKGGFRKIFLEDELVYIIADFEKDYFDKYSGICVLDVSNPKEMREIKQIKHSADDWDIFIADNIAYLLQRGIDRDTSYTDWYFVPGGLRVIDVSKIKKPQDIGWISLFDLEAVAPNSIVVVDEYAIIAHHKGLEVIEVAEPTKPVSIANYPTKGSPRSIFQKNGFVYIADDTNLGIYRLLQ